MVAAARRPEARIDTANRDAPHFYDTDATVGGYYADLEVMIPPWGALRVHVEADDDGVLVGDLTTGRHGTGETFVEALLDLSEALYRHRDFLEGHPPGQLAPELEEHLVFLKGGLIRHGIGPSVGSFLLSA